MKEQYKKKDSESIANYIDRMIIVMDWSEDEVDVVNEIVNKTMEATRVHSFNTVSELMKSLSLAVAEGKCWKGEMEV